MIQNLEKQYLTLSDLSYIEQDTSIHILVLGGGHTFNKKLPPNNQLSNNALGRLVEGIRLHRLLKDSKIITSGTRGSQAESQAKVLSKTAQLLGVSPDSIASIETPVNTMQEAIDYKKQFGIKHKLILVTDASHMPRAMMWFKKIGLNPIAAPTNHILKDARPLSKLNGFIHLNNIDKAEIAAYEYCGILWAQWKKI